MVAPRMTATEYNIDASSSRCVIKAFVEGLLAAFSHDPTILAPEIAGRVHFVASDPQSAWVTIVINTHALTVAGDVNERDRREIERGMRDNVLEVAKYPDITFRSTAVTLSPFSEGQARASITGSLSLHGVTREVRIDDVVVSTDGERVKGSGTLTIVQSDYGIVPVHFAAGAMRLKDELSCSFEIVALIRPAAA
jgi:polyisoprenoid-binding protein YceI